MALPRVAPGVAVPPARLRASAPGGWRRLAARPGVLLIGGLWRCVTARLGISHDLPSTAARTQPPANSANQPLAAGSTFLIRNQCRLWSAGLVRVQPFTSIPWGIGTRPQRIELFAHTCIHIDGPPRLICERGRIPGGQRPLLASMAKRAAPLKAPGQQAHDAWNGAECGLGGTVGSRCGPQTRSRPSRDERRIQNPPSPPPWLPLSIGLCSYLSIWPQVQSLPCP
jgi:hypothetical protein